VELLSLGGLNTEEIAEGLKVFPDAVLTDWGFSTSRFCREMQKK
jgi:hypothetical protein